MSRTLSFNLATVDLDGVMSAALEMEGNYWPLLALRDYGFVVPPLSMKELIEDWPASFAVLNELAHTIATDADLARLKLSPSGQRLALAIQHPSKLIAVGANYLSHLKEMGLPQEKWPLMPFFFVPPTTTMLGTGGFVRMPRDTHKLDWEIELAVVIGKRMSNVDLDEAMDGIAGYAVGVDLSARDLFRPALSPTQVDVARAKGQDTMKPFGPFITPAAFITNPHDLAMRLTVNGRVRQESRTSEMMYRIDEQISIISQFTTLEPGDVLFTGTPAGSATVDGYFLAPGDRIIAEIEGIGKLNVQIASARPA